MTTAHAVALGLLQGLGEFLPISSSGHLIVAPWLLGWPPQGLAFDVALHLGTLFAVIAAFARDWLRLLTAALSGLLARAPFAESDSRLLWLLVAATVPGAAAGKLLEGWAETTFRAPALVAVMMAAMGAILLWADRRAGTATTEGMALRDALLVGAAQAAALVPGVSRSGATISMALMLGYRRDEAARFSFLLAVPITAGAALLKVPHLLQGEDAGTAMIGMVVSAIVGFASIRFLLGWVRTRDYRVFVAYRFVFAAVVFGALLFRGASE
ncbi:MAG TPA: undecaprenyl-diphosphate phosphatase [Vicinamibacteria bacterium]|nr:undecaprenyl-diphosphate phosphatase [Vicinamibacteria bacterium]